jgi:hypothetical protein
VNGLRAHDPKRPIRVFSGVDMDDGKKIYLSSYCWKPEDDVNLILLGTSFPALEKNLSENEAIVDDII